MKKLIIALLLSVSVSAQAKEMPAELPLYTAYNGCMIGSVMASPFEIDEEQFQRFSTNCVKVSLGIEYAKSLPGTVLSDFVVQDVNDINNQLRTFIIKPRTKKKM